MTKTPDLKDRALYLNQKLLNHISDSVDRRKKIYYLHIGKTAGTQINKIKETLNSNSTSKKIKKMGHHVNLSDLPDNSQYFFSIRDPISRFRSGFYSRKRQGLPKAYSRWSKQEEIAFDRFPHANTLAESLFEPGDLGTAAYTAMQSISHISKQQHEWFKDYPTFLSENPPLYIIRQEHFSHDIRKFFSKLEIPFEDITEQSKSHQNDYRDTPDFTTKAIQNLRMWYSIDTEFYKICESWLSKNKSDEN